MFAFFLCFFISACTPKITVKRLKPAEINLSSYEKIAMGDIQGAKGDKIAGKINQRLFESKYFDVVERSHLKQLLQEQDLSISNVSDPDSSVKLGEIITGSAMIFGKVFERDYRKNWHYEDATCYDEEGNKYACTRYSVTGKWNLSLNLKMVDTSTGQVLASKTFEQSASRQNSQREDRPEVDWSEFRVFNSLEDRIIDNFMQVVAPHEEKLKVCLYKDSDLPRLKKGIKYARHGDWKHAIANFKSAVNAADKKPQISAELRAKAYYDLGVAYGYSKKYQKGINKLEKAIAIKPLDVFFKEKNRIEKFREQEKRLKEQGVFFSG